MSPARRASRRQFLAAAALATAGMGSVEWRFYAAEKSSETIGLSVLPKGPSPAPVPLPHFPDRLHAFVWRNWELVQIATLARVVGISVANVAAVASAMGLPKQPRITTDQRRRSYITIIKRNWHLLPYEQLLELLGWSAQQLAYTLREDDFLYLKLGGLKPNCPPLTYVTPDAKTIERERQIAATLKKELGELRSSAEPLFAFVKDLSSKAERSPKASQ